MRDGSADVLGEVEEIRCPLVQVPDAGGRVAGGDQRDGAVMLVVMAGADRTLPLSMRSLTTRVVPLAPGVLVHARGAVTTALLPRPNATCGIMHLRSDSVLR